MYKKTRLNCTWKTNFSRSHVDKTIPYLESDELVQTLFEFLQRLVEVQTRGQREVEQDPIVGYDLFENFSRHVRHAAALKRRARKTDVINVETVERRRQRCTQSPSNRIPESRYSLWCKTWTPACRYERLRVPARPVEVRTWTRHRSASPRIVRRAVPWSYRYAGRQTFPGGGQTSTITRGFKSRIHHAKTVPTGEPRADGSAWPAARRRYQSSPPWSCVGRDNTRHCCCFSVDVIIVIVAQHCVCVNTEHRRSESDVWTDGSSRSENRFVRHSSVSLYFSNSVLDVYYYGVPSVSEDRAP